MKATVQGIIIFGLALRAHLKGTHSRFGAVIWHALNYGEPRATIGAVSEGIPKAAVLRFHHLAETCRTGSDIGRDKLVLPSLCLATSNLKALVLAGGIILDVYGLNASQRWCFRLEFLFKLPYRFCFAFYLDSDIFRSIADPALEVVFDGQSVNEWPEANALNNTPDADRSESGRLPCRL
jgi:hypothetical protein